MSDEMRPIVERPTTSIEDAVRWWVGEDGDHTSMLYYLSEWEAYAHHLELINSRLEGRVEAFEEELGLTRERHGSGY
jgi:hypothetical protein